MSGVGKHDCILIFWFFFVLSPAIKRDKKEQDL